MPLLVSASSVPEVARWAKFVTRTGVDATILAPMLVSEGAPYAAAALLLGSFGPVQCADLAHMAESCVNLRLITRLSMGFAGRERRRLLGRYFPANPRTNRVSWLLPHSLQPL
jgi:hypothetical protein